MRKSKQLLQYKRRCISIIALHNRVGGGIRGVLLFKSVFSFAIFFIFAISWISFRRSVSHQSPFPSHVVLIKETQIFVAWRKASGFSPTKQDDKPRFRRMQVVVVHRFSSGFQFHMMTLHRFPWLVLRNFAAQNAKIGAYGLLCKTEQIPTAD